PRLSPAFPTRRSSDLTEPKHHDGPTDSRTSARRVSRYRTDPPGSIPAAHAIDVGFKRDFWHHRGWRDRVGLDGWSGREHACVGRDRKSTRLNSSHVKI